MSYSINLTEKSLPSCFKHILLKESNQKSEIILRSNVCSLSDIGKWISEFSKNTSTRWNVRTSKITCSRMLCSKCYVCHHSSFNKVTPESNKKGESKNTFCSALVRFKVKLTTVNTKKRDPYVRQGLPAIIFLRNVHNHPVNERKELKYLQCDNDVRDKFMTYFEMGMVVSKACKHHENELRLLDAGEEILISGRTNPSKRTVAHWYRDWRLLKEELRDPLNESTKTQFEEYFGYGMGPQETRQYIKSKLLQSKGENELNLPSQRLVLHWFNQWKQENGDSTQCDPYEKTKKMFFQYFNCGMSVQQACSAHEKKLMLSGLDHVKCKIKNPLDKLVAFWHHEWKMNSHTMLKENNAKSPKRSTEPETLPEIVKDNDKVDKVVLKVPPNDIADIYIPSDEDEHKDAEVISTCAMKNEDLLSKILETVHNLNLKFSFNEDTKCYEKIMENLSKIKTRDQWKHYVTTLKNIHVNKGPVGIKDSLQNGQYKLAELCTEIDSDDEFELNEENS